jgi:SpoU rRNA methylase family enzyme
MSGFPKQSSNGVDFQIAAEPLLTYVTAFNGRPFLYGLAIASKVEILDATVTVSITSQGHAVSQPWSAEIGRIDQAPVVFEDLLISFDSQVLLQQSQSHVGEIRVSVTNIEGFSSEVFWNVQIDSPNTWRVTDNNITSLAAFVQPQDPTLGLLQEKALQILRDREQTPAWTGYQSSSHVRPMVEALYSSVLSLGVVYSNPPASWDASGQRIRSAQTVVEEKLGTCLDTALLFASLLEKVDLAPLVALIPGHAFVGYWTARAIPEGAEPSSTEKVISIADVINLVDAGIVELFETTCVCEGSQVEYHEAIKQSKARMSGTKVLSENANHSFLIDLVACRLPGPGSVNPLPVRYQTPDGNVELIEYKPTEISASILRERLEAEGKTSSILGAAAIDAPPVVKRWLDSLLDLSLRNPLINFREPQSCIPLITVPDTLGTIEDMLQLNQAFTIAPNGLVAQNRKTGEYTTIEISDERGNVIPGAEIDRKGTTLETYVASNLQRGQLISKYGPDSNVARLRKMASSAKTYIEETGSNGLFLALGSLVWQTKDSREVRSPLILIPVKLIAKNRSREFDLVIDAAGEVTPNYSLAEKLHTEFKITLDKLVNLQTDDNGIDIAGTFQHIREVLIKGGVEGFRVDENAVLGFFNFSTYRLWRDMVDNWKTFKDNSVLVDHFVNRSNGAFEGNSGLKSDINLDELVAKLPISADSSQALAVSEAMAGKTFVLQGPPGTGKSQTITNLLAFALSEGKRVLFVAEKKDALDVVKDRLDVAGLGAFSLDLHDKGMTPRSVREQLLSVINVAVEADKPGFEGALRDYENALTPLIDYRERLHQIGSHGESLYTATDQFLLIPGDSEIVVPGSFISKKTSADKESLYEVAKTIATFGPQTGDASKNAWSLSTLVEVPSSEFLQSVETVAVRSAENLELVKADKKTKEFLANVSSIRELALLRAFAFDEADNPVLTSDANQILARKQAIEGLKKLVADIEALRPITVENLDAVELDNWISKAQEAATSFALFRKTKLNSIKKKVGLLLSTDLQCEPLQLPSVLIEMKALKQRKAQCQGELASVTGLRLDSTLNLFSLDQVKATAESVQRTQLVVELIQNKHDKGPQAQELAAIRNSEAVRALVALQGDVLGLLKQLGATDSSINRWLADKSLGSKLIQSIPEWAIDAEQRSAVSLTRWISLLAEVKKFDEAGIPDFSAAVFSGEVEFGAAPNAFLKGYFRALGEILVHERGFTNFESLTIQDSIRRAEEAQDALRERLPRILADRLLENRGFDATMKVGAISDLISILRAKNSRLSIRNMLAKYWSVIMKVTPCVLASPDSVVQFIDASVEPFDLVVFDEASQIRVANSVGALGRAKSAVVVGDSEQMPPTNVAQVKGNQDEEEEVAEDFVEKDSESILSLAKDSNIPDVMLKWHYRSADESLIAFSNKRYYNNDLSTFPSPSSDRSSKGLSFTYVKGGKFVRPGMTGEGARGTNVAEIDAIVKEIAARLKDPATKDDSIGVVTFNKEQMEAIKNRLLDSKDTLIQKALVEGVGGEEIFVKNLETVQGSERDVILFSVAFSTDEKGVLPLRFGPLGQNGGHRRLNVAVTRARKQVKVFCSFKPEQLKARNPQSKGIKHLAEFLELANEEAQDSANAFKVHESRTDRHRRNIAQALREAGLDAREEVGMSDFKVDIALYGPKDKNKAVLGILLDGPRWNARKTVTDRDILPVNLLSKKMGWAGVERIWIASWLRNKDNEIARIKLAFEAALKPAKVAKQISATIKPVSIFTTLVENEGAQNNPLDRLLSEIAEWEPLSLVKDSIQPKQYLDLITHPKVVAVIQAIAVQLTSKEGPVSEARLAKYVGSCFGFDRVVAARAYEINAVPYPGHARDKEGFLFPAGVAEDQFTSWRKGTENAGRLISDISLQEIARAMYDIVRVSEGIKPELLNKETSRLFGIQKVSAQTDQRLSMALSKATKQGLLKVQGDYIVAVR